MLYHLSCLFENRIWFLLPIFRNFSTKGPEYAILSHLEYHFVRLSFPVFFSQQEQA